MSSVIAHVVLLLTMLTAWQSGRAHQPIALALTWVCIGDYLVSQPVPALMIYMATATTPVSIVDAAWGAGQSTVRPYFSVIFGVGAVIVTLIAMVTDRLGVFGQCMALVWLACALVGGAALYRSDAPPLTRSVLILLVGALPCEAVGWLSWGAGLDIVYVFSRFISTLSLLIILGIQVDDGKSWRQRWANLQGHPLGRIREWARTGRRTELDNETTKVEPRG